MTERDIEAAEADEADLAEQQTPVVDAQGDDDVELPDERDVEEADPADVDEQRRSVGRDDEDDYR